MPFLFKMVPFYYAENSRDPKDCKPINVDTYVVFRGLPQNLNVPEMIVSASTSDDENFRRYQEDCVFVTKEIPGEDHWLNDLPSEVVLLLERQK